jgi:SAM-dependent methyltransferase
MDIRSFNREAWNRQVEKGNRWTLPVEPKAIAAARKGQWEVLLTPSIPAPRRWFPPLEGTKVLCLASGGGQQGPLLAAAGAQVTVFDNSPKQLAQDRLVAARESLELDTVEGDMRDLSLFADESFDLIFHPVSNVFVPEIRPVWREAFRVLRPGGLLLAGFTNPLMYLFDFELMDERGILEIKHSIPYSDLEQLSEEQKRKYREEGWPMEFSHTLDDQIGGQIEAGFLVAGFYEDSDPNELLSRYIPTYIATRAVKPDKKLSTARKVDNSAVDHGAVVNAVNGFAFRLLNQLYQEDRAANIFFSPFSIAAAVTMTANGARGQTLEDMWATLGLEVLGRETVNRFYADGLDALQNDEKEIELTIANSIWAGAGIELKDEFIRRGLDYFDAEIRALDFSSPQALAIVNGWVEDKTGHKIKELL